MQISKKTEDIISLQIKLKASKPPHLKLISQSKLTERIIKINKVAHELSQRQLSEKLSTIDRESNDLNSSKILTKNYISQT